MNWSKGLLRFWFAITAVWLVGSAYILVEGWPRQEMWRSAPLASEKSSGMFDDLIPAKQAEREANVRAEHERLVRKHVTETVIFAVLWPTALLALGWGALWVGRGFRPVNAKGPPT